jgi:DNA polymerase-3 subunit alpha
MAGIITELKKRQTRAGKAMAVFNLEDDRGTVETVVFPDAYEQYGSHLADDEVVVVEGSIKTEGDEKRIFASEITPISRHKKLTKVKIEVDIDIETLGREGIREFIDQVKMTPGDTPMDIRLFKPGAFDVQTSMPAYRVSGSADFIAMLQELAGSENVRRVVTREDFSIS